jgi:2-polyprenyl-3-methyl-5-hydroxy-6-metoxy-1,4-benzoquinol methylase
MTQYHVEALLPSHRMVLERVPDGAKVLEPGCATGVLTRAMAARGCRVTIVDVVAEALEVAAPAAEQAVRADLEQLDWTHEVGTNFDVVVLADVLEHLRAPEKLLSNLSTLLAPRGIVVASIPNVAYWSVRRDLLRGRFDYTDVGLLDRTHLRFFTERTVLELFTDAGYRVEDAARVWGQVGLGRRIPDQVERAVEGWWRRRHPNLLTYQFVLTASLNRVRTEDA